MMDSCGACEAEPSSETSSLTLTTDPPAAPALFLLATETIGWPVPETLEVVVIAIAFSLKQIEGGALRRPPSGLLVAEDSCFQRLSSYDSFDSSVRMFCGMVLA